MNKRCAVHSLRVVLTEYRIFAAQARDGQVRPDSKHGSLSLTDRLRVRAWLEAMDAEMAPIQSWMP